MSSFELKVSQIQRASEYQGWYSLFYSYIRLLFASDPNTLPLTINAKQAKLIRFSIHSTKFAGPYLTAFDISLWLALFILKLCRGENCDRRARWISFLIPLINRFLCVHYSDELNSRHIYKTHIRSVKSSKVSAWIYGNIHALQYCGYYKGPWWDLQRTVSKSSWMSLWNLESTRPRSSRNVSEENSLKH